MVMPLFLALFFGIIESALIADAGTVYGNAAQQAARLVALLADSSVTADGQVVAQLRQNVQPLFFAHISTIEIFRSDAAGDGPSGVAEDMYDGTGTAMATQTWPVTARVASVSSPVYAGVRITFTYVWLTSFIGVAGTNLTLRSTAVMPLDPLGG